MANGKARLNRNKKIRKKRRRRNGNGFDQIPMPTRQERIFPSVSERSITPEIPTELFD